MAHKALKIWLTRVNIVCRIFGRFTSFIEKWPKFTSLSFIKKKYFLKTYCCSSLITRQYKPFLRHSQLIRHIIITIADNTTHFKLHVTQHQNSNSNYISTNQQIKTFFSSLSANSILVPEIWKCHIFFNNAVYFVF